jgi:hypothetical protein
LKPWTVTYLDLEFALYYPGIFDITKWKFIQRGL